MTRGMIRAAFVMTAVALGLFIGVAACNQGTSGGGAQEIQLDGRSIGGVVLNVGKTPEAGVWVIAETTSLPTHFRKIAVTDDQGRFVVPDLPEGAYGVWVRGYGLQDSQPVKAERGQRLTLPVANARSPQEAAQIYPANYWLSLFQPPSKEELPEKFISREHWIAEFRLRCIRCHQQGAALTRLWTRPEDFEIVWHRAESMSRSADGMGREALKKHLSAWAASIAAGEVPPAPPRPAGVERNVVVSQWEWGNKDSYLHSMISADRRNPELYPYGKVYAVDYGQDRLWSLDPKTSTVTSWKVPTRKVMTQPTSDWAVINNPANPHCLVLDENGGMWIAAGIRPAEEKPKWAGDVLADGTNQSDRAKLLAAFGDKHGFRQMMYFDTKTEQFAPIDTAFNTMHLSLGPEGRLWISGDSTSLGMIDTKAFDPKNPESQARAQKAWLSLDPETGESLSGGPGGYGVVVNPLDGTVWRAMENSDGPNNKLVKFDPKTGRFKDYPLTLPGRGPRGIDATTDGRIWFSTGSGHLGRFDPKTEQFAYFETPTPKFKDTGKETGPSDFPYGMWVDRFDTSGLGKDMVILTGSNSDSVVAFNPTTEKWVLLRVPFPMSMFPRHLDGRIDDAKAGWKGRGLWVDNGGDPQIFTEKIQTGVVNHIQVRPNPLAY